MTLLREEVPYSKILFGPRQFDLALYAFLQKISR